MNNNRKVTVNITNKTFLRAILWVVGTIIAFKFIGRVGNIITLILISVFLALALNPIVGWVRKNIGVNSRGWATALSYLLVVLVLTAFFSLITPPLVHQTRTFIQQVPQTVSNFQSKDNSLANFAKKYKIDKQLTKSAHDFAAKHSNFGTTILTTGKAVLEFITSFLAVLVMTFMMLVEGPAWLELYFGSIAQKNRRHHKELARKMYKAVSGFVNGQVILAIIAGFFAFLALEIAGHILNVPTNAAALAGIVSALGIIPLFGNPVAAVIVVLFSLLNSFTLAVVMAIYFVLYFFIENHTFQPYLQSRLNELTPLTVFVAALIGVSLAGILGALVAIPAAAAIKILLEDYFEQRQEREPQIKKEAS